MNNPRRGLKSLFPFRPPVTSRLPLVTSVSSSAAAAIDDGAVIPPAPTASSAASSVKQDMGEDWNKVLSDLWTQALSSSQGYLPQASIR